MKPIFSVAALLLLSSCATAHPAHSRSSPRSVLPLKSVRLYETGVGYFERHGTLPSDDEPGLPVPEGHLDDALKTLVVLTPGGKVPVGGVEFGSRLSHGMARALAGLPQSGDDPPQVSFDDLLTSMEGSLVTVRVSAAHGAPGVHTGRLVHVESVKPDGAKEPHLRITLLGEHAEALQLEGGDLRLRPVDSAQAERLDAALESLLSHGQSRHLLRLLGAPGSPVALGYIAETPVWRTSYRLVIAPPDPQGAAGASKATLQAWALVHNDTDEDWRDVKVELVNGRPDSFLFPMAAPRYASRTLVTPENELSTVPQLMGKTADTLWGDHVEGVGESGGMSVSGHGYGAGGGTIGLGSIGTVGHGGGGGNGESSLLSVGNLAGVVEANGVEAGALFVYGLPNAMALRAHASALVPFLQRSVDAEQIAWIDPSVSAVARSGVRLSNSTPQTLPDGTIAFFADGGFAGESSIDRLKPNERRFLTFGVDLDVEATSESLAESEATERVTWKGESLSEHYRKTTEIKWSIENRSGQPRTVYVALDLKRNAKISGADGSDYDTKAERPLIRFTVAAKKSLERTVTNVEGLMRSQALDALTSDHLKELATIPTLAAGDRAHLTEAYAPAVAWETSRTQLANAKLELDRLDKDVARLREDAKAIGDHGAGAQPIVTRMVTAEDQLRSGREQVDRLEREVTARRLALRTILARLQ